MRIVEILYIDRQVRFMRENAIAPTSYPYHRLRNESQVIESFSIRELDKRIQAPSEGIHHD